MTGPAAEPASVLLVDSDAALLDRAGSALESALDAVTVETVSSGEAAVERLGDDDVDCFVSGFDLPGMDGLDLLVRVRDDRPRVPFVLWTDHGSEEIARAAISADVTAYLEKPGERESFDALANEIADAIDEYRTDQALREREQRYRTLVEHSHDGIYIYQDDEFRFVDDRTCEITGYEPAELEGMDIWDLVHPDDRERLQSYSEQRRRGEEAPTTYDARILTSDGETRHLEFNVESVNYEGEWAALGSVRDVTDRLERDAELVQYRTIVEAVGDAVYIVDASGSFTLVNEALSSITGYDESELVGEHVSKVMRDEDVATAQRLIEQLLKSDEQTRATFEMEAITDEGERIPCEDHVALLQSDGQFLGTAGVVRDISERKEREQRLRRQNERLDQFAGVVSHDLRNPLNVVQGRLTLARETGDEAHFEAIERAVGRMERLIDDLLTLARDGKTVGTVEPIDLEAAVRDAWEHVDTKEATLAVDGDLGSIAADRDRLASLFENLARNAIEHGGEDVTVRVGRLTDDPRQEDGATGEPTGEPGFYVEDDGTGIPPSKRDRVLEQGYTSSDDGTGLGLVIVEGIADAHGWSVSVTDAPSGGARFEITGVESTGE